METAFSILLITASISLILFLTTYDKITSFIRIKKTKKIIETNTAKYLVKSIYDPNIIEKSFIGYCVKEDNPFRDIRDLIIDVCLDQKNKKLYYQYVRVTFDKDGYITDVRGSGTEIFKSDSYFSYNEKTNEEVEYYCSFKK